jgi:hypothetical protein
MDRAALAALKRRVRPVGLSGMFTLEQASAAVALNREVARFHAAVTQTERILALAGSLDLRLVHELTLRAGQLMWLAGELGRKLEAGTYVAQAHRGPPWAGDEPRGA